MWNFDELEESIHLDPFLSLFIQSDADEARPENYAIINVTQFGRKKWRKDSWLRTFHYPEYLICLYPAIFGFISHENDNHNQIPCLYIRPPTVAYSHDDFHEAVQKVVEELRVSLEKHGRLLVETSAAMRDEFTAAVRELGLTVEKTTDERSFYMNETQLEELKQTNLMLPEGFEFTTIDLDTELRLIHEECIQGQETSMDALRSHLRDLPSFGVREIATKKLVAWEFMSPCVGKFNHLHCDPDYRGRGLGLLTEQRLAQICAEKGLRVFKTVQTANEAAISGTSNHPMWTTWTDEEGKPVEWAVTFYNYAKIPSND